jgi:HPt (histidine-containing phosphotransfer) domain-containing protein
MQASAGLEPLFDSEQLDLLRDALGPDELLGMLSQLPDAASQSLDAIRAAIVAGNVDEAHRVAHTLKGFSSSLGAARLSSLARQIELDLDTASAISAHIPLLSETIDATLAELSRAAAGA